MGQHVKQTSTKTKQKQLEKISKSKRIWRGKNTTNKDIKNKINKGEERGKDDEEIIFK